MNIFYGNFGSKTIARCGFISGIYTFPEHIHQFAEIVFCAEGSMEIAIDGNTELMNAGDFAIIPPFRLHSFYTPEYVKRWICVFSDDLIPKFVSDDEFFAGAKYAVFHADGELVDFLYNKLPDNNETLVPLSLSELRLINMILTAIYEDYLRKAKLIRVANMKALPKILLYVRQNYKENLTLQSIGNALGYSAKYVSNCICKLNHFNLPQLINSFRIDEAKQQLIGTNKNVIDIGLECGYKNEKSFYRAFRSIANTTPAEYRRRKRSAVKL